MQYEGLIYFAGPMTLFGRAVADKEIIARHTCRWLWMARLLVRSAYGPLDKARCGYIIKRDGQIIERVKAADEGAA